MFCVCGKSAHDKCGKCETRYCSRTCQLSDWPKHKFTCIGGTHRPVMIRRALEHLHEKIYGNILIVSAWSDLRENASYIKVELDETIEDYILTDTHFAYLSACSASSASSAESIENIEITGEPIIVITKNKQLIGQPYVKILFKFSNYSQIISTQLSGASETIRSKYPRPSATWSILL